MAIREDRSQFCVTNGGNDDADFKKPVVFLFGWAGCSDRQLSKYSNIYETKGFTTVRHTLPTDMMFLLNNTVLGDIQETSRNLFHVLRENNMEKRPVLFHVFSNSGAMLYRWTSQLFLEENVKIIGVTMDSCPSRLELPVGLNAIYFVKRPAGLLQYATYVGRFFLNAVTSRASGNWDSELDVYEALKTSNLYTWPHLFLYSANDGVIPPGQVIEMLESRRAAGSRIARAVDFQDSIHVRHFKVHQEKYIAECNDFVDECCKLFQEKDNTTSSKPLSANL